jgi:hypothetical protein
VFPKPQDSVLPIASSPPSWHAPNALLGGGNSTNHNHVWSLLYAKHSSHLISVHDSPVAVLCRIIYSHHTEERASWWELWTYTGCRAGSCRGKTQTQTWQKGKAWFFLYVACRPARELLGTCQTTLLIAPRKWAAAGHTHPLPFHSPSVLAAQQSGHVALQQAPGPVARLGLPWQWPTLGMSHGPHKPLECLRNTTLQASIQTASPRQPFLL